MAGLAPTTLRLPGQEPAVIPSVMTDTVDDVPEISQDGAILKIEHGDGSITVSLDGRPIVDAPKKEASGWFDNLVEDIEPGELSRISEDLIRGVEDDLQSRQEWVETRAQGIRLLGFQIELPSSGDTAPVEGMSRYRDPTLQEAVLRFQANAMAEMLPTDGPVKIRDDGNNVSLQDDDIANAFEKDFNHYLTVTASEYYPDTDKMLLLLGFGGTTFKKIYYCPLRNRPVSETVDADDLIVNNAATDLRNAKRITHRVQMRPSTVKRLQILGVYRDIDLSDPKPVSQDAVQVEKKAQQGVTESANPEDRDRELYEVCCELDIAGFEHEYKGGKSGLEIPYRVTLDVSSREILSITRNYDEDTKDLPSMRESFVKYTYVPGLGFYDLGLLNILGNSTNAITAGTREMLDAGMFANFPGFLYAKSAGRQVTNVFRIPPGGGAPIDLSGLGDDIRKAVMALPYKEPGPAMMALIDKMVERAGRVGGTSELQVGEGRQDAPVGTTLALIEQATKVLNAVHKRMHTAQAREMELLKECFREHPESFWQSNKKPAHPWDQATFLEALDRVNLVPRSDPNTASHTQRLMKIVALKQLQAASPNLYDPVAVDKAALQAIGWSNPEQFLLPEAQQKQLPPEIQKGIEELKIGHQEADAKTMTAQAAMIRARQGSPQGPQDDPQDAQLRMAELQLKGQELAQQGQRDRLTDENRDKDRATELQLENQRMAMERMKIAASQQHERAMQGQQHQHDHIANVLDLAARIQQGKAK